MIFTKDNAFKILDGKKTQTRRMWLKPAVKVGNIYKAQLYSWREPWFAKIKVIRLWKWDGENISQEDAIAEGYGSPDEFMFHYLELNMKLDLAGRENYAIEFEVVETQREAIR